MHPKCIGAPPHSGRRCGRLCTATACRRMMKNKRRARRTARRNRHSNTHAERRSAAVGAAAGGAACWRNGPCAEAAVVGCCSLLPQHAPALAAPVPTYLAAKLQDHWGQQLGRRLSNHPAHARRAGEKDLVKPGAGCAGCAGRAGRAGYAAQAGQAGQCVRTPQAANLVAATSAEARL